MFVMTHFYLERYPMPMKLNVGLTKKLGLPHYSSLGATCHIEIELDQSLLFLDLDAVYERVRQVYTVCRQSVTEELARQRDGVGRGESSGRADSDHMTNGNDTLHGDQERPVSRQQLSYLQRLAQQIPGLSSGRLESMAQKLFQSSVAKLRCQAASELIAALKDIKAGKLDLRASLNGAGHGAERS